MDGAPMKRQRAADGAEAKDEPPAQRRSKAELQPAVLALTAAANRLSALILEASGTLPFLHDDDAPVVPLSRLVRPVDVPMLVAYAQKISYSTAGPPLTPGGMVTFMPHPLAMRLSSLYTGVPGLSKAVASSGAVEAAAEPAVPPLQRPHAASQTHAPAPAAALLNLDLDEGSSGISSDDESSSSSSASASAEADADGGVGDGW